MDPESAVSIDRPSTRAAAEHARSGRVPALDQLRSLIVGLVVLHHSVLAYCTFGHVDRANFALSSAPVVDPQRWIGFDVLVRLEDSFFMSLLFLLSGLFVRDALVRRGAAAYLRSRVFRLGLPFAVAELTLVPLAYYPSFLQAGGEAGLPAFWLRTITTGPAPSGPPWFLGVLLLLDAVAASSFALGRRREPGSAARRAPRNLAVAFALFLTATCLAYLPLLSWVGPTRWVSLGPLAVQASRIGLYATSFAAGVLLGRHGVSRLVPFGLHLARRWPVWVSLAVATGTALLLLDRLRASGALHLPVWAMPSAVGLAQAALCTAACFAVPAVFLRFGGRRAPIWDSLAVNGFAIYLLHYPIVTWLQFAALSAHTPAPWKGMAIFVLAFAASWIGARTLRLIPAIRRVL